MLKMIGMLKRKAGMSPQEFARYWREEHAPLGFDPSPFRNGRTQIVDERPPEIQRLTIHALSLSRLAVDPERVTQILHDPSTLLTIDGVIIGGQVKRAPVETSRVFRLTSSLPEGPELEKRIADTQKQATEEIKSQLESQLEKLPLPKLKF